jgi:alkylhydroperoxidase family enzyme
MIRSIILRRLDKEEKKLGESVEYLRHVVRTSLGAFFAFVKFMKMAQYRKALPADAAAVAGLVATMHEDCGTCVQIGVHLARAQGVPAEVLRAVVERRPEALPEKLADVYRFAEKVCAASYDEGELRERVRAHYGEEGLVEMALAMASAKVFPVTKRALGYAVSCRKVEVNV